jgi:CubicO group peptidase (beta-lactamase class C family)
MTTQQRKIAGAAFAVCAMAAATLFVSPAESQIPVAPKKPPTSVAGDTPKNLANAGSTNAAPGMTAEDVDAFLDGMVPAQLQRENIAGCVVLVVKDGKVLFAKGYGYANVEEKKPVTVDATLFRPGSISKLLTWTAVMQQVERGKLDLDRDVNEYLDFKIPPALGKPITLRDIMTHTAGFEDELKDVISPESHGVIPLEEYLKTHLPNRIYQPSVTGAYSNYATGLAGYIVQRVSGMPYDDYMEKNIFEPLDMEHSSYRQPLPPALKAMMSSGYKLGSGKAEEYEFLPFRPAGTLASTAEDMSHFMLAHLQGGEYNGVQILKPETIALMHTRQYSPNPATNGVALGFYEQNRNGLRIIGHGGDTIYFHSLLMLIPERNTGIYISYNSAGKGEIDPRDELWNQFLDRYYPYKIPPPEAVPDAVGDGKKVEGRYIVSRRGVTNIFSFLGFLQEVKVTSDAEGTITTDAMTTLSGEPKKWKEIRPMVYRAVGDQDIVAFSVNPDGPDWTAGRMRLSVGDPFMPYDRVSLEDNESFNIFLFVAIVGILGLAVVLWPVTAWMRRHYQHPLELTPEQRRLRLAIRLVCAVDVVYFLWWVGLFSATGWKPFFETSVDPMLRIGQLIGWVGSLGTLLVLYSFLELWGARGQWWLSRIGNAAIVLACVSFSWFLYHWHLLHFNLNY